ncbi:MAG: nicotinate phosphoribosyltransferase [Actinomycetota bacterium]
MALGVRTDLYQLTMVEAYLASGLADKLASYELFFRAPPDGCSFAVAAGLEPALDFLESLRFDPEDLDYLRKLGHFSDATIDYLAGLRFSGEVWAVPEGTIVFAGEPLLRVTARLPEAQLAETGLLNLINFQTLVATAAARLVRSAGGRDVVEFGLRRAQGPDGGLSASRASYLGGCVSTSNVEAGLRYGIPVAGTQAHAFIMAFPSEIEAFRAYAARYPDSCVLLVDTYDTLASGVPNAVKVGRELAAAGHDLRGIRLDSGDMDVLSRAARKMMDEAGLTRCRILASGDLTEGRVRALVEAGAPIDIFGVGTWLVAGGDDRALGGVFKLVEVGGKPVLKVSSDPFKATLPGCKQIWRGPGPSDTLGFSDEEHTGAVLLEPVMRDGRRLRRPPALPDVRRACVAAWHMLPDAFFSPGHPEPLRLSDRLASARDELVAQALGNFPQEEGP